MQNGWLGGNRSPADTHSQVPALSQHFLCTMTLDSAIRVMMMMMMESRRRVYRGGGGGGEEGREDLPKLAKSSTQSSLTHNYNHDPRSNPNVDESEADVCLGTAPFP